MTNYTNEVLLIKSLSSVLMRAIVQESCIYSWLQMEKTSNSTIILKCAFIVI